MPPRVDHRHLTLTSYHRHLTSPRTTATLPLLNFTPPRGGTLSRHHGWILTHLMQHRPCSHAPRYISSPQRPLCWIIPYLHAYQFRSIIWPTNIIWILSSIRLVIVFTTGNVGHHQHIIRQLCRLNTSHSAHLATCLLMFALLHVYGCTSLTPIHFRSVFCPHQRLPQSTPARLDPCQLASVHRSNPLLVHT